MSEPVIDIRDLRVSFPVYGKRIEAVRGVSLKVHAGEIVGLIGESGSGKTVTAMSTLGLYPAGSAPIATGSVKVMGEEIFTMSRADLAERRGSRIALVPQEPATSLNPTMRIRRQLVMAIQAHRTLTARQAETLATDLLEDMRVVDPRRVMRAYPFELSGGLRQRVLLAMAFSCSPSLLIADEPTSALDVTTQKRVLDLLVDRAKTSSVSVLLVTHDMSVGWHYCDRIYVMCRGEVVESGTTASVLENPRHSYTRQLLNSLPERSPRGQPLPVGQA